MIIRLRKHIHSGVSAVSTGDEWLVREIELPFIPFVGLEITDGNDFNATIKDINWNFIDKRMDCWTAADDEIYKALLNRWEHRSLDEIVSDYLEMGWERQA